MGEKQRARERVEKFIVLCVGEDLIKKETSGISGGGMRGASNQSVTEGANLENKRAMGKGSEDG